MGKTTGVTGFVLDGNYGRAATILEVSPGEFKACDRTSGVELSSLDPFLTQWLSQRAMSSALIRAGIKDALALVRLDKIVPQLKQDKRAVVYTTEEFVRKMDPRRADDILASLGGTQQVAKAS